MMSYTDYVSETGEVIEIGDENAGWKKYLKGIRKDGSAVLTPNKANAKWYPPFSQQIYADTELLLPWVKANRYYITSDDYVKRFERKKIIRP